MTLQVLGHRSASGGLPPNSYPAAGTGSAAAVPEGQGDGQTSKVNLGAFQQSKLSAKGQETSSFLRWQTLQGHRTSPEGCLFFPAAPCEAAHKHINKGLLQRSWNPISEKQALGVTCRALLGGDPVLSTGTLLSSSRDLHLLILTPNAPSFKICSPAELFPQY